MPDEEEEVVEEESLVDDVLTEDVVEEESLVDEVSIEETDSEINSEYYQKLEPYIARSFVIQYDSDKGSTKKHDMYFFDEKGEKVIEV